MSIITPCYNEAENVEILCERIRKVFDGLPQYHYEQIIIDNASLDGTAAKVKQILAHNPNVRLIVNARNFGHIRSPVHAILQARGDVVVTMASDLQDPPELIPSFLEHWEQGFKIVVGVKPQSEERGPLVLLRTLYYAIIRRLSDVKQIPQFTGFGLYDRRVIEVVRQIDDPYPYFRGLVADIGFDYATVTFKQPKRAHGITKNNFYTLYDLAMLGITNHSKVPLRLATMFGFLLSGVSFAISMIYIVLKLALWYTFPMGSAPILIGMFFFSSVQLFFIGLLGEYVLSIHTQVHRRPLVVEAERFNFPENEQEGG